MDDNPTRRVQRIALPETSPGTSTALCVLRYGSPGARPKVYVQAALHADEIPGMLVASHLVARLDAAASRIRGEIVVVPVANPLGSTQVVSGRLLGRYALTGAGNYNRLYPDLTDDAAALIDGRLGADAATNVSRVRAALAEALAARTPLDETQWLRHTLLGLALDADVVLDLHCDDEALLHLYVGTASWPDAADLSAELGSRATLLAECSGGNPFDEAVAGPWWALARRFGAHPLPAACLAATVELRGHADVDDAVAASDAEALLRFLVRRGVVDGDPGPLPEARCEATRLDAVELVRAPARGIVSRLVVPGASVRCGECVAEIADPLSLDDPKGRLRVACASDGLVFARNDARLVRPGDVLCKIAGRSTLAERRSGALLTD